MTKLGLIVRLTVALGIVGGLAVPTHAEDHLDKLMGEHLDGASEQSLSRSSQTLAQTPPVQITNVRIEETDAGLQIVLETADGELLSTPATAVSGDALIVEISNAVLVGEDFEQFEPAEGIAFVQLSTLPDNRVQVVITGEDAAPTVDIGTDAAGLTLSLVPGVAQVDGTDESLRLVVTGEEDEGYNPSSATTATRTDTPLRDIPQSIQVVPRQVIEDRNVRTITEAVETVSGVVEDFRFFNGTSGSRRIRGFTASSTLRNGFPESPVSTSTTPLATIEQLEILKGPSSVITGAIEPGGVVNYVTKQPLSDPYYNLGLEIGNFGLYQPSVDLSGPLTADRNVLYRFIAAYEGRDSFQEFANSEVTSIAPSVSLNLGDQTDLNLYYEYNRYFADPYQSGVPLLSDGTLPSQNLYPSSPFLNRADLSDHKAGYTLTHRFDSNWQVRNNFAFTNTQNERREIFPLSLTDDRFLSLATFNADNDTYNYFAGIDVLGEFETGDIAHQLLAGFDFNYFDQNIASEGNFDPTVLPPLDILNPNYDGLTVRPAVFPENTSVTDRESYGIYLQDQIAFSPQWKLLIGGRYDWISEDAGIITPANMRSTQSQSDGAFSPRVGLVYQPNDDVSLYTSYSRSFNSVSGRNPDGSPFEPTRGTQYEVGVKADFLDGRLSTTLAAYNLTRTNVLAPNPDLALALQGFQVQVGEQRSRGIELDIAGKISPGWNIIASYALTDTKVTADSPLLNNEGNSFANVPEHQASLWTTYEIQEGDLQGLGVGLGLFYVGERQGDLANSFQVDDYLRTDAALFYRKDSLNTAINIRNLFDVDYVGSINNGNRLFAERGEPFSIVGSISWEF
ncbi:hypothetical protein N836_13180 [Leptolyngbya sp. Heron Island J]|uniref:TonB-dependent siderophore receptor n=1 Tax=Leptolyngbya sp. Heron Island J TaxID=1385935 RepID=UPI0003B9978B|nr:TonB-dependent siderophore receptor [Leptolyngbya sp. Heron Island J]ESA35145.1 hypothetical protein N836_13180 [Leptolyngbya sp. Heron Island J]